MKILTDTGLMLIWQRIKDLYKKISVSAKQTTTSTADGGTNVMTFTFGDGTSTTLSVKNGSKGSDGAKGEKGDRGPVGETGPQGNSGIADASNKALINDAVTGGETSYLSAEVGKLGILTYDCSKGGTVEHASLQDAINAVPTTFQKVGITIIYKSRDSIYRYALKSNSWSTDSTNWFSVEEKVSDLELNVDDFKDGFSKNGNNIFDPISQLVKEGVYASILNGHIIFNDKSETPTWKVFCIPVKESKKYIFSSEMRFVVPTMDDKYTATSSANIEAATNIDLSLYPNTRYLFVSFNDETDVSSTLKIAEGTEFINGLVIPNWCKDMLKDIHFNDIKGKVKADMMEGYENSNIFSSAELYAEGYYVNIIDGHIVKSENSLYNIYIIEVEPTSKYTFTNLRFALPLASDKYTAITSSLIQEINTIDMSLYDGVKYLAFSFNKNIYPLEAFVVSKGEVLRTDVVFPSWVNDAIDAKIIGGKVPFLTTTRTTLTNGQYFVLPSSRTNLRKGMRVVATADVSGTGGFELGFSISDGSVQDNHNTIIISDTHANFAKNGYTYQDTQDHGLTISGKIVVIFEYNENGTATYTILANGKSFKHTIDFLLQSVSAPYLMSNGATLTDCKLTLSCTDIEKKIWCFGDSYFAYSAKRWTYYLREYGYDKNVLLDGFPGEGSVLGRVSFATLLSMGTPKYAIWFLGMNDGSDPNDTTPSTSWASNRDIFLSLCNQHGVKPVFATIPNVPSINHNGKNAWIKASGYRYIDMCHAVGADVNVNWLGTMLSSDKIHPSEDGARALFAQVIQDFPEVMVELNSKSLSS